MVFFCHVLLAWVPPRCVSLCQSPEMIFHGHPWLLKVVRPGSPLNEEPRPTLLYLFCSILTTQSAFDVLQPPDIIAVKVGRDPCFVLGEESLLLVERSDRCCSLCLSSCQIYWPPLYLCQVSLSLFVKLSSLSTLKLISNLDALSKVREYWRLSDRLKAFHLPTCSGEVHWNVKIES